MKFKVGHMTNIKHGYAVGTPERLYKNWTLMRDRCNNPRSHNYRWYGARGIKVCEEWSDYPTFRAYVTALPHYGEPGRTLDRIDSDDDYRPGNVRWATTAEQFNTYG